VAPGGVLVDGILDQLFDGFDFAVEGFDEAIDAWTAGLSVAANRAMSRASISSVLASRPMAPAKRRTFRGETMTTGRPLASAALTNG
jgi:hypothetical protein